MQGTSDTKPWLVLVFNLFRAPPYLFWYFLSRCDSLQVTDLSPSTQKAAPIGKKVTMFVWRHWNPELVNSLQNRIWKRKAFCKYAPCHPYLLWYFLSPCCSLQVTDPNPSIQKTRPIGKSHFPTIGTDNWQTVPPEWRELFFCFSWLWQLRKLT